MIVITEFQLRSNHKTMKITFLSLKEDWLLFQRTQIPFPWNPWWLTSVCKSLEVYLFSSYVCGCLAFMHVCVPHARVVLMIERSGCCISHMEMELWAVLNHTGCWKLNSDPLIEQLVPLTVRAISSALPQVLK